MLILDLEKVAQYQQPEIQGSAIDDLISTVQMMFNCGVPNQWDDTGFNKVDYSNFNLRAINDMALGQPLHIKSAVGALYSLAKYQKKQIPNYQVLYQNVQILINEKMGLQSGEQDELKVSFVKTDRFGAIFLIKGIKTKAMRMISSVVKEEYRQQGLSVGDAWKAFNKAKEYGIDYYRVKPSFILIIKPILDQLGYDTTEFVVSEEIGQIEQPQEVLTVVLTQTDAGPTVTVGFPFNRDLVNYVKIAPSRRYNNNDKTWDIFNPDKGFLIKLGELARSKGLDTTSLEAILDRFEDQPEQKPEEVIPGSRKVGFFDVSKETDGLFHLSIIPYKKEDSKEIVEFIRFCFPTWMTDTGLSGVRSPEALQKFKEENAPRAYRRVNKSANYAQGSAWAYELKGKFSDYFQLETVLSRYGFDTTGLRTIIRDLFNAGVVELDKIPGKLEGYRKENPDNPGKYLNDTEKFKKDIDDNYNVDLWPLQKEGVEFLYGRSSTVLGDSTGTGKTIMLAIAADMRMKQDGGRCLIITLNATQKQWMKEIEKVTGEDEQDISFDPTTGHKWTILRWNDFTMHHKIADPDKAGEDIKRRDLLVRKILEQNDFTVLILDECHNVKNNSIQTKNVQAISSGIPYVWGATATIIANKPIDAYNQLKTIGHRLGQLPFKTFKEHFGGWNKKITTSLGGRKKIRLEEGTGEEQMRAAGELRRWLTLSGVYLKRSKKDMNPDLPNHLIQDNLIDIDVPELFTRIAERYIEKQYKDPSLMISQLQAARAELAKAKVPYTLELAKNVLLQDKKVIVFTAFTRAGEAGDLLMRGVQDILNNEVGSGTVTEYSGNIKDRSVREESVRQMQDKDSDTKAMVIGVLAGGTGLDLPNVVDDVIMNDFSWTPKDAEQAEGRAFRITSENDVTTTYVVADNCPDKELYEYVQSKKKVANMIQSLTRMETDLIMQGKKPSDVQTQILDLQKKDKGLDTHLLKYLTRFMGQIRDVGGTMASKRKSWYKSAGL